MGLMFIAKIYNWRKKIEYLDLFWYKVESCFKYYGYFGIVR